MTNAPAQDRSAAGIGRFMPRSRNQWILSGCGGLIFLCVICGVIGSVQQAMFRASNPELAAATDAARTSTRIAQSWTATPEPTKPTNTPKPSNTPAPTSTPRDTSTPRPPTNTPGPTDTPTPPPTPIVLSGSGDSVVDIEPSEEPMIVHIVGNSASRFFSVISHDASGEQLDLLVNTTDVYDGVRPINFVTGEYVARFVISAPGPWTIEIMPALSAPRLEVPGTIEGVGDGVFIVTGADPDTAHIIGNADGRYFGVFGYDSRKRVLVNETDPYDGTVIVNADTVVIEVQSVGAWSVEITAK